MCPTVPTVGNHLLVSENTSRHCLALPGGAKKMSLFNKNASLRWKHTPLPLSISHTKMYFPHPQCRGHPPNRERNYSGDRDIPDINIFKKDCDEVNEQRKRGR